MNSELRKYMRNAFFKVMWFPISTVVIAAAGGSFFAAYWTLREAAFEAVHDVQLERILEDVSRSPHYSASSIEEFMQAIETLSTLRRERALSAGRANSLAKKLRELELEDKIMLAETAVIKNPLAAAASKRTLFEELVLTNNKGGGL